MLAVQPLYPLFNQAVHAAIDCAYELADQVHTQQYQPRLRGYHLTFCLACDRTNRRISTVVKQLL